MKCWAFVRSTYYLAHLLLDFTEIDCFELRDLVNQERAVVLVLGHRVIDKAARMK